MQKIFPALFACLALGFSSGAVETKNWRQDSQSDFEKGTLNNLSLRSDGRLFLAPVQKEIFDSSTPYLWTAAEDSSGNLYVGGGGPGATAAKVFQIDPQGNSRMLAEVEGLEIHAIAIDQRGRVYAAASPDGVVYRIGSDGKAEVFYDPKAKYVWAMAFNSKGDLLVATGDLGEIHRVRPDGKGSVFFKTEETHARSLVVDERDNVIVGTEPGGLILRISPAGDGFVLYQSEKREVTAVAVAPSGAIYASAVGNKQPTTAPPLPQVVPVAPPPTPQPAPTAAPAAAVVQRQLTTAPPTMAGLRPTVAGGSEIYRIEPDGYARKVWSHAQEIAYALAFDTAGRPLIGTGNQGNIYRLDSDLLATLLLNLPPTQVTGITRGQQGSLYAVTGNIGKVYQIGPNLASEGVFESDALDAGSFSYWGRLSFRGATAGGSITLETRSGNLDRPQQNWSSWMPVLVSNQSGRVSSPAARFLQYKMALHGSGTASSPEVAAMDIAYLPKNVGPVFQEIEVTPANYRFPPQSLTLTPSQNLTLPPLGNRKRTPAPKPVSTGSSQSMQYAKGYIGARWLAQDENGDELTYKVEIRGDGESDWKLLKDPVKESYLSWDSSAFPDGLYRLRVTVSDSPSNPPQEALTGQHQSEPFLIDNTPPQIMGLAASRGEDKLTVRWKAADARSVISKAEYSVNGGEWSVIEPTTRLSDSLEHEYNLVVEKPPTGENTIAVRVTDEFDNQAVEKTVVH